MAEIFDDWPERYDQWFETPIGQLVKKYESKLILDLLEPKNGESILDAGCGTGVFSRDLLSAGARGVGCELSMPMLLGAARKIKSHSFNWVQAEMGDLPFGSHAFDKAISVTAIEFIEDAKGAVEELFRVTRPGGCVVVATLNSLSPWATRRKAAGVMGHPLFRKAFFRSPEEIRRLSPVEGTVKTAIHFRKETDPKEAEKIEKEGQLKGLMTGAFIAAGWKKPVFP
jgi:ubiquinone/menaquinone biosynthesis C-methylase UbiE